MGAHEQELLDRMELIREVRDRMRDYAELNTLIDGEESTDREISYAADLVLDYATMTPPPVGVLGMHDLPRKLLIDGIIAELLESVAFLLYRNQLTFQTGGVAVQFDQAQNCMMLSQGLGERFRRELDRLKVSINHQQAVDGTGGIRTQWSLVNRPTRALFDQVFSGGRLA